MTNQQDQNNKSIETVRGFKDNLPPKSIKRQKIMEIAKRYYELYGFVPIETPTIEFDELLKGENQQDEAISDRFRLKDKGNRELGLRYEFTVQLSRILKENPTIKLPFKRYQIGSNFRDEPIKANRCKEFVQCDADILGDPGVQADAECLVLATKIFNELGIKTQIVVNNRKLLNEICKDLGVLNTSEVFREIDKLDKIGEMEVKINLSKILDKERIIRLFEMLNKSLAELIDIGYESAKEIKELQKYCKFYGLKFDFLPSLMRGFGYYTGNIFEIRQKGKTSAIAGGGRYDKKVGKFINREIPAVGISFSLESIENIFEMEIKNQTSLIISIGQDEESIKLAEELRNNNIPTSIQFGKISKGLDYANSLSMPFVIFVGEEEIKSKKFKIKDMQSGLEETLKKEDLIKKLSIKN